MGSLKGLSEEQSFELVGKNLDELSGCLEQLNAQPQCAETLSRVLRAGALNDRIAAAIDDMRENVNALERALAESRGRSIEGGRK